MKVTDARVEQLARWPDETYLTLRCRSYGWGQLPEDDREAYRHAARDPLERPPPPLPDAPGGRAPDHTVTCNGAGTVMAGRAAP
jgi:hypothetical protein